MNKTKKVKLTKTQKMIFLQLSENTGAHFLDSGGIYGRNYDKYKDVPDFNQDIIVDEYGCYIPIQTYMNAHLTRTKEAEVLEKKIISRLKKMGVEYPVLCYSNGEEIAEILKDYFGVEDNNYVGRVDSWTNTYNYDNDLTQVLQYVLFEYSGDYYIIVETHNGCDVRGGYSDGRVYEIKDIDSFLCGQKIQYSFQDQDGEYQDFDYLQNDWVFDSDKKAYFTKEGFEVNMYANF
jgi:hypothetical protein